MTQNPSRKYGIKKIDTFAIIECVDQLASEEPMEIKLAFNRRGQRIEKSLSVTMRTPGNDIELTKGFLFTEGIINSLEEIVNAQHWGNNNIVLVELVKEWKPVPAKMERNFYTTSSCGVCGKSSIEAIKTNSRFPNNAPDDMRISSEMLYTLPGILREHQDIFDYTGGLHGCALFDNSGSLLFCREDIGRHNALDKLIGLALDQSLLPLDDTTLLLSGRASFELIQKAWMAGIKIVAAVGAPSSLAVELAIDTGITLVGFLRGKKFNIYSGDQRIKVTMHENSY